MACLCFLLKGSIEAPNDDVVNHIFKNNGKIVWKIALRNTSIFVKMGDLLSNTGKFLESSKVSELNLFLIQNLKLIAIVEAIPSEWRLNVKRSQVQPQHLRPPQLSDTLFVFIDWLKLIWRSKLPYREFQT